MKCSRASVRIATRKIPQIRPERQELTSYSGLVLFQRLFGVLDLKNRLRACVVHVRSSSSYGLHTILHILIVHSLLGWRRLSDLVYYRDDVLVQRILGLKRLPHASVLSRSLRAMSCDVVEALRGLVCGLVLEALVRVQPRRLTLDFDGSVISTKSRQTEGTAVGFNRKAKGCRSYYPLFCTVAQSAQVLDVLHRPGNVHDSNESLAFIESCYARVRSAGFGGIVEARLDSAHFSDETCFYLALEGIEFSVSVPFERFVQLKGKIEKRRKWHRINDEWSFFEANWKPKKWPSGFRLLVFRRKVKVPRKGPIQLSLFEPIERDYEYKAVMTNKTVGARSVLDFHNGRGAQEGTFAELKSQVHMGYIPTRRKLGNQIYLLSTVLAHNLARELQMRLRRPSRRSNFRRACLWSFEQLATLRKRLLQRGGRLTKPQGRLTLTVPGVPIAKELVNSLAALGKAA